MYHYHGTDIHAERLARGRDHCDTPGPVYDLAHRVVRGRVIDPERSGELTTTAERRLIFAVSGDLHVHVGFDGERGRPNAVKHETLFHNAPVQAAGEMQVEDGVITGINDQSGSYNTTGRLKFDSRMAKAILTALLGANVPMTDAVLDFLRARATNDHSLDR